MARPALAVIDTEPQPGSLGCLTCGGVTSLLTVDQAAELLGIGRTGVYELVAAGRIPAVSLPGIYGTARRRGGMRIRSDALQAFIDDLQPAQ